MKWTRERVIERMQAWAELYGGPPTSLAWSPAQARRSSSDPEVVARFAGGDWPNAATVVRLFGSWNAAIEASGFEPMRRGEHRGLPRNERQRNMDLWPEWSAWRLAAGLRAHSGLTQAEVAEMAHVSTSWINHLENGGSNPQIRPLIAYARAIGVHPAVFVEQVDDE